MENMKRFALLILFLLTPLYIIAQGKGALISFETDTIDYGEILKAVSYTHLTLPTIYSV